MTNARYLISCFLFALSVTATWGAAKAATRSEVKRIVVEESLRAGFPPSLAMAVAKSESDFRDDAESRAGARGVMQVMPRTAKDLYGIAPNELWDARLNAQIGIDYLESLIRRYHGRWDIALSHYNGGSAVGPPSDARVIPATSAYVNKVLRLQRQYRKEAKLWASELKEGTGDLAMIRPPYSKLDGRAVPTIKPKSIAGSSSKKTIRPARDDFMKAIELRRRIARQHLDDFVSMVPRSDG